MWSAIVWIRALLRHRTLTIGAALTGLFVVVAAAAPLIAPGDPLRLGTYVFHPPSGSFLFGTDDLGRDVLQGIVHGARTSLAVGLLAAGTAGLVGALVGGLAGYAGSYLDEILMRMAELVQVVPRFFLALLGVTLAGPSLEAIILLIGLTSWPLTARLVRGEVLRLRAQEYVVASIALGASDRRILLRAILPNALPPVIAQVALQVATAMLIEAGLAFLGVGDPTVVSWGAMLHNGQRFMRQAWWLVAFPGVALSLAVLGVNLLGDGLTGAWTPRLRQTYDSAPVS
jgi:peptide/nickel transport system permease protein